MIDWQITDTSACQGLYWTFFVGRGEGKCVSLTLVLKADGSETLLEEK